MRQMCVDRKTRGAAGVFFILALASALSFAPGPWVPAWAAKPGEDHSAAGHQAPAQTPAQTPAPAPDGGAQAPSAVITIPVEAQQRIGVKTVAASVQAMRKFIRSAARIEVDERQVVAVSTKVEGYVEQLSADYTGRPVKRGEALAQIYSPEIMATQMEYLNLLRWRREPGTPPVPHEHAGHSNEDGPSLTLTKDADTLLSAARQRLLLYDVGPAWIDRLARTGKPTRTIAVISPATGVITRKNVVRGMKVMPGETLFEIVDLSSVWVVAEVFEYELPHVQVGQRADIQLSAIPGRAFQALVEYVAPSVTPEARTVRVRFSVPNRDGLLKPQMFAEVDLNINLGLKLAVPEEAVIDTGVRKVAYVETGPGRFEVREVMTGAQAEGLLEIRSGLKPGDKVAAAANFLLDAEARLKGSGGGGHQH